MFPVVSYQGTIEEMIELLRLKISISLQTPFKDVRVQVELDEKGKLRFGIQAPDSGSPEAAKAIIGQIYREARIELGRRLKGLTEQRV